MLNRSSLSIDVVKRTIVLRRSVIRNGGLVGANEHWKRERCAPPWLALRRHNVALLAAAHAPAFPPSKQHLRGAVLRRPAWARGCRGGAVVARCANRSRRAACSLPPRRVERDVVAPGLRERLRRNGVRGVQRRARRRWRRAGRLRAAHCWERLVEDCGGRCTRVDGVHDPRHDAFAVRYSLNYFFILVLLYT